MSEQITFRESDLDSNCDGTVLLFEIQILDRIMLLVESNLNGIPLLFEISITPPSQPPRRGRIQTPLDAVSACRFFFSSRT